MDWLQTLLDNSTTPLLTAFLLGLLTALSPCPLATNIAAIGFIGKDIENRRQIFRNGLLYTLGRIVAYTLLGTILITVLKEGSSMFGIQKTIGTYGEWLLGPLLLLIGLFMLFGSRLNLPQFGFSGNAEAWPKRRVGCFVDRHSVCSCLLSYQWGVLLWNADSDVGYCNCRLCSACGFCCSNCYSGTACSMGTGVQCAASGHFLRKDAGHTEMAESGGRSAFCHYWHVLLLYHIFIINNHLKNI